MKILENKSEIIAIRARFLMVTLLLPSSLYPLTAVNTIQEKKPSLSLDENSSVALDLEKLPTINELMSAKLISLKNKLLEQEILLKNAELTMNKEKAVEALSLDDTAYVSLSIVNNAPPDEYKLVKTEVYLDGAKNPISLGGKRNQGLPRNNKEIFFAPMKPGCHEIMVRAEYIRIKNNIINRFLGVDRVEKLMSRQAFIAKNGYRIEIEIEGFEAQNTFVKMYRGPELRFNRSVRPNILPKAFQSMDSALNQGRVRIDYLTESESNILIEKKLSIDGMPILTNEKHDKNMGNIVFEAPLSEGRHTLIATLVFAYKSAVGGGPVYNFRLNFERVFYVMNGQTTVINLIGMPKDGARNSRENSRYARVTSKIVNEDNMEFFPVSCEEIKSPTALGETRGQ